MNKRPFSTESMLFVVLFFQLLIISDLLIIVPSAPVGDKPQTNLESQRWQIKWILNNESYTPPLVFSSEYNQDNSPQYRVGTLSFRCNDQELGIFGGRANAPGSTRWLCDMWLFHQELKLWKWIHGVVNYNSGKPGDGSYAPENYPGSRGFAYGDFVSDDTLLIFGGIGGPNGWEYCLNDLHSYNVSNNQFRNLIGDYILSDPGVYNKSFNSNNKPSSRNGVYGWVLPSSQHMLVFGGVRCMSDDEVHPAPIGMAMFNDLWLYSHTRNEWRWVKGSQTPNRPPVYGTTFREENIPGSRMGGGTFKHSDNLVCFLFGYGFYRTVWESPLNDLWCINISNNHQTFLFRQIKGVSARRANTGLYGHIPGNSEYKFHYSTKYDDDPLPGGRHSFVSFDVGNNEIMIFGGCGWSRFAQRAVLNDFWMYNIELNRFKWIRGSDWHIQEPSHQSTEFHPSVAPSGQCASFHWEISKKRHWIGFGLVIGISFKNDLFEIKRHFLCFDFAANMNEVCSGYGDCIEEDDCSCFSGHFGENCEISVCTGIMSNASDVCLARGKCNIHGVCDCYSGFFGVSCEHSVCGDEYTLPNNTYFCNGTILYPGFYCKNDNVYQCEAGYYCPGVKGASDLYKCPSGEISSVESSTCIACSPGTYEKTHVECLPCPDGQISKARSKKCEKCKKGFFEQNNNCTQCMAGTYTDQEKNLPCTTCPYGYYCLGGVKKPCSNRDPFEISEKLQGSTGCIKCDPKEAPSDTDCQITLPHHPDKTVIWDWVTVTYWYVNENKMTIVIDLTRRELLGLLEGTKPSTRNMCVNEYWLAMIDSNNTLFMIGDSLDNDHIKQEQTLTEIDTSAWIGDPEYVKCTQSSVFVVTIDRETGKRKMYMMGKNEHHELEGGKKRTFFELSGESDIINIATSYHSLYILEESLHQNFTIKVIGSNYYGSFGSGYSQEHSGFSNGEYSIIHDHISRPVFSPGRYPHIYPMEFGVYIAFDGITERYYAGKDHPSTGNNENVMTWINFGSQSALKNGEPIDFIDRLWDGAMYIVSGEKIFISGDWETDVSGIRPKQNLKFPFEITSKMEEFGSYDGERIFMLKCAFSCFLLTEKALYIVGSNDTNFQVNCENNNCRKFTLASESVAYIHPGSGTYDIIDGKKNVAYDTIHVPKATKDNVLKNNSVNEYPPTLVFPETGLVDNQLSFLIKQPEVFGMLDSRMNFEYNSTCNSSTITSESWTVYSSDVENENGETFRYYYLSLPWSDFPRTCGWKREELRFYDSYKSRLRVSEIFYRGMRMGEPQLRREIYYFDIEIRFKKVVFSQDVQVAQEGISGYFELMILDHSFDRETRTTMMKIAITTKNPNYLVFPDLVKENDLTTLGLDPQNYDLEIPRIEFIGSKNFLKIGSLKINEVGDDSVPNSASHRRVPSCSEIRCYQTFVLSYQVIDDPRVCTVEENEVKMSWVSFCDILQHNYEEKGEYHPDCVHPPRVVSFVVSSGVDNICGGLFIEDIATSAVLLVYPDFAYSIPYNLSEQVFNVNDWLYVRAEVFSEKVDILEIGIHQLFFVVDGIDVVLYEDGETSPFEVAIDDFQSPNYVGFHFQLTNNLLQLQIEEERSFQLICYLEIMYLGNDEAILSHQHRRKIKTQVRTGAEIVETSFRVRPLIGGEASLIIPFVILVVSVSAVVFCILLLLFVGLVQLCTSFLLRSIAKWNGK